MPLTWLVPNKDQIAQDTSSLAGSERSLKERKVGDGKKGGGAAVGKGKVEGEAEAEDVAMEAPGGPAQAAAQGARAVRRKKGGEAYHAKVDPKLKKLLTVLIKQVLANTQQLAWMVAAVFSTYLMPIQSNVVKALKTSRKLYADKCKEMGKGHALGPPEGHLYMTLIMTLCTEDVGGKSRALLTDHGQFLDKINAQTVLRKVKHIKLSKCYDSNQAKLTLFIEQGPWTDAENEEDPTEEQLKWTSIKDTIHRALLQVGAIHKEGKAPAGVMEDELAAWLAGL